MTIREPRLCRLLLRDLLVASRPLFLLTDILLRAAAPSYLPNEREIKCEVSFSTDECASLTNRKEMIANVGQHNKNKLHLNHSQHGKYNNKLFCTHRWKLSGNYPVFAVVMLINHYIESLFNIYNHSKVLYREPVCVCACLLPSTSPWSVSKSWVSGVLTSESDH